MTPAWQRGLSVHTFENTFATTEPSRCQFKAVDGTVGRRRKANVKPLLSMLRVPSFDTSKNKIVCGQFDWLGSGICIWRNQCLEKKTNKKKKENPQSLPLSHRVASLWLTIPLSVMTSLRRSSRCTFPCGTQMETWAWIQSAGRTRQSPAPCAGRGAQPHKCVG